MLLDPITKGKIDLLKMLAICYKGMQNSMTFNINEYKKDKQQRFDPCWTTFNIERYNKNYKMLKTQIELIVVKAWHPMQYACVVF